MDVLVVVLVVAYIVVVVFVLVVFVLVAHRDLISKFSQNRVNNK